MTEAIDKPNPPLMRMFNLRRGLDEPEVIDATIREGVTIFGTNLWVLLLAMLIASIGLDVNSTAVIIGAMLISPLMGPIVGVGYGLAIGDLVLIRKGTLTLLAFTAVSLLSSTAYFTLSPLSEPGSELLARTSPTLWDVLIAFFGGAAGIIALTRRSFSNVLPGVAIATALMPPLCTTGYSIANGHWGWAAGAFYLFTINGVFIAFATLLFVKLIGLPERADVPPATGGKAKILTALTVIQRTGEAFAGGGELQALEYRHFVRELVDHGLLECGLVFALGNQCVFCPQSRIVLGQQVLQQLLHLRVQRFQLLRADHGRRSCQRFGSCTSAFPAIAKRR